MASRLDRLFTLLETGSSTVTRRAAANQLGEVQRLHPHELHNLLKNILTYLKSNSWDTRIAAAWAVEAVLSKVPQWDPIGIVKNTVGNGVTMNEGRLNCEQFDVNKIMKESALLMGSEGKEYETVNDGDVNSQEKLSIQRERLNSKLGLGDAAKLGIDTNSLYTADDLKIHIKEEFPSKANVGDIVGLSCREVNRAKRKARQAITKQRSKCPSLEDEDEPDKKKIKIELNTDEVNYPVPETTLNWPSDIIDWPLDWFCVQLTTNLFSPNWEIRHGAGTALRHLMKSQGKSGGKSTDVPLEQMENEHQAWLEDIALRLICVLTLDRFGDFVCDQVVAPVRETSAQALGSVVDLMSADKVIKVLLVLLKLLEQKDWETRHGGLLGIKYIFAVRQDLLSEFLPVSFDSLYIALSDPVDDVSAVAAGALSTTVDLMASHYPEHALTVLNSLCKLIPEQDDLTPAAVTFIPLLSQLLLKPNICPDIKADETVTDLVQRLWSLLEHNNSSVRSAALQTLSCLPSQKSFEAWPALLQPTLRHIFQRALIEHQPNIHKEVENAWYSVLKNSSLGDVLLAACPYISIWLCLSMQQPRIPFDHNLLIHPKPLMRESTAKHLQRITGIDCTSRTDVKYYIGGSETQPQPQREANTPHVRYVTARMLGFLSSYLVQPAPGIVYTEDIDPPILCYVKVLSVYLDSKSALQRFVTGLVIAEWCKVDRPNPQPSSLTEKLMLSLNEAIYYDEIAVSYTRLLQDTKDYIALVKHYKLPVDDLINAKVLTLEQMDSIIGTKIPELLQQTKLKPKTAETLLERRKNIHTSITGTLNDQNQLHIMTQASLAGAVISLGQLPDKLTPLVKPLMESIKRESNEELQLLSAAHLAALMQKCLDRDPCPNAKIVTNLCSFLLSDPDFTPRVPVLKSPEKGSSSKSKSKGAKDGHFSDMYLKILTLEKQQTNAERAILKRSNSTGGRTPGRPPLHDVKLEELIAAEDQAQKFNRIQRRGCTYALSAITDHFGSSLPSVLPNLWDAFLKDIQDKVNPSFSNSIKVTKADAEYLVGRLQVLEVASPSVHLSLLPQLLEILPHLTTLLSHPVPAVRHLASRAFATLAKIEARTLSRDPSCAQFKGVPVMSTVVEKVVPMLFVADNDIKRQGATEVIAVILEKLQMDIIPYILFLIVPLLGRMSDQEPNTRVLATQTFADLIQLMPLDGGIQNPPQLSPSLMEKKESQKQFLDQLFNPSSITDYEIPISISAELRSYQQAGVNWLAFLNKFKLHGLLCDDMGLGKTLQSICILASDHFYRHQNYVETRREDFSPLPSLVICPPTLTGHWVYEVEKFVSSSHLKPLLYIGAPQDRVKLRSKLNKHQLVVASYDIVRKDIDFFSSKKWNYCILDEGHMIKNAKTKASRAIKQISANNRLILSGTPIQNNVLELWSLFDFLMPGFLGTEKQFTARYSKPILASRDPKSSTKEQEAGVLAMEALHRQVLPFVLRRTKEDVLKDLPPKITQDYYCELSPLQRQLYEDFSKSQSHQHLEDSNSAHIFQSLRYLQSVCNHPKLALTPKHPQYEKITKELRVQNTDLSDIQHAAKLPALKQLLIDCGIGVPIEDNENIVVNQHRALIFCQLKIMLDILENDLFKAHMPSVTYLRLDGTVPADLRHSVVTRFNNDPSIDVLIMTTQVGGLGLNLTGADTVIFIEHDWSPMKDLQAMDRAHRIGQKKVVNVYRLITRDTLEEKIMGLQKFKLMTANTVISSENASLQTMGTDKLLDLFSLDSKSQDSSTTNNVAGSSIKSVLDTLPELWDHKDYDEEYDMSNFIKNLRS